MQIRDPAGTVLEKFPKVCTDSDTWVDGNYDTSEWSGRQVVLWFTVHDDGVIHTYFLLDDVIVEPVNVVSNHGFEEETPLGAWNPGGAKNPVLSTKCDAEGATLGCLRDLRLRGIGARPLGMLTRATLTLDRNEAMDGFKSFGCVQDEKTDDWKDCRLSRVAASGLAALVLLPFTIWLLLVFIGIPSLRLKRLIFLMRPTSVDSTLSAPIPATRYPVTRTLRQTYSAEPKISRENVYALEDRAFAEFGVRRPRELSLDLFAQAMLMIPLLIVGLSVLPFTVWLTRQVVGLVDGDWDATNIVALFFTDLTMLLITTLVLLLPVGRLAQLRRIARQRAASQEGLHMERGGAWPRRGAAQLIDLLCICALAALLVVLIWSVVGRWFWSTYGVLAWLPFSMVVLPAAALSYHSAFAFAPGSWKGRTLGNVALGLHVVGSGEKKPSFVRTLVRDVLLKWFLFVPLILPGVLNILWPLWDYRRRAWHDIVVGTVIVRVQREAEPAVEQAPAEGLVPA